MTGRVRLHARTLVVLAVIVVVALGFRLWMLHSYSPGGPWVAALTLTDAEMGRNLLAGRGWVANSEIIERANKAQEGQPSMVDLQDFLPVDDAKPGVLITPGTAHSPGYSLWFALSYFLGGSARYGYSQLMQAVLDAAACLLVFGIGRRLWSRSAGLVAAALYAMSPAHAFLANLTVAASTDSFWFLTVAYGAVRAVDEIKTGARPWRGCAIVAAGALCGAAMNSTSLVLPAVVAGTSLLASVFDRRLLRLAPYLVAAQIAVMLALTPWAMRNENLFGQFSPVRGGFWQVAFAAWGELPNPWGLGFDDKYYWNWIEEECPSCDAGQQAAVTRTFILSSVLPSAGFADHLARLVVSRLPRLVSVARTPGGMITAAEPRSRDALRIVLKSADYAVFLVVVLVLAGLAVVVLQRGPLAVAIIAIAPSVFLIAFSLVFFVELRKTVPAYGCLLVFAGIAITELARRRRAAVTAALLLALIRPPAVAAQVMAGGEMHTAVVKPDGTVWSWGLNTFGQLADGRRGNTILDGVQAIGLSEAVAVAAGAAHTLALRKDGSVWAWGDNFWGELGNGGRRTNDVPARVAGLPRIVAIACGYLHSLALADDGSVWAWGDNHYGQLGLDAPAWVLKPLKIQGLTAASIDAGFFHSLAINREGGVIAWGKNANGQLGDATTLSRSTPAIVTSLGDAQAVAGGQRHTLVLRRDGSVWSWGGNMFGQLGRITRERQDLTPAPVPTVSGIMAIAAGEDHSVVLAQNQEVWTWGDNLYGQLGDGSWDRRVLPVKVPAVAATAIASGPAHSLALTGNGTVATWGYGNEGQLGDNVVVRRRANAAPILAVALVPGPDFSSSEFQAITSGNGTWMAPVAKFHGGSFMVQGKADSSTGYVVATPAIAAGPDQPLKVFAATGSVTDGCVTVGIQENNQWIFYKNFSRPGPFTLTWTPSATGSYAIVAAHCLPEGRLRNDFEVSHIGWFNNTSQR